MSGDSPANRDTSVFAFLRTVPTLDDKGENWKGWKFRIERAAVLGGVEGHLSGAKLRPATGTSEQEAWDHNDARAMNFLVACLSDTLAGQLHSLTTAAAWSWLCHRFEISNRQSIQSILSALCSLKAKNLEGVGKFLDNHEEILSRAREIDFALVHDAQVGSAPAVVTEASNLHYVYSDFILDGLPSTPDWTAWAAVYRTSESSTFAPREILDKSSSSSNDKKDSSKSVTFAAATVAASIEEIPEDNNAFPTEWYLDTCATSHTVTDRAKFVTYEQASIPVSTAAGPALKAIGRGNVEIGAKTCDGNHVVTLLDAVHVPESAFNLVSGTRFVKAGFSVIFNGGGDFEIAKDDTIVLEGTTGPLGLPQIEVINPILLVLATPQEERLELVDRAHLERGHPSKAAMRDMLRLGELKGFTTTDLDVYFNNSFSGAKYFIIVRDEASGWVDGEPLREKTQVPEAFKKVYFRIRAEFESSKVGISESTTLQTDNGSEFNSRAFETFLTEQGISRRFLIPQQNGLSERTVRTVKEKITTCLTQARLSKAYWAEIFYYALFIIDNLPYSPNGGETPYHYLHHRSNPFFTGPVVPVIGQEVWVHDPDAGVFDEKAYRGIFLGVGVFRGTKGFRVQHIDNKGSAKVHWSRNVQSSPGDLEHCTEVDDEDDFSWSINGGDEEPAIVEEEVPAGAPQQVPPPSPGVSEERRFAAPPSSIESGGPRRGSRERQQATWKASGWKKSAAGAVIVAVTIAHDPEEEDETPILALPVAAASTEAFSISGCPVPEKPASTKDALTSNYSTEWREGMDKEWDGFRKQDVVGDLVPRTEGMKVLGTRWHHTVHASPEEEKAQLKSRLVVQGVKTIPFLSSFGPTFTPLPRWDIVAVFFVLATRLKLPVYITDFAKAYLGAKVATDGQPVFVKQPPGYEVPGREDEVYELCRAAYGLPQSGRAFHLRVKAKLDELNFVSISDDVTLYVGRRAGDYVLFVLYVDDGLIAGKKNLVEDVIGQLQEDFDVTFKGEVDGRTFLGRDIKYDPKERRAVVKVSTQIEKALKMHGFQDVKPLHMPIQPGIVYKTNEGKAIHIYTSFNAFAGALAEECPILRGSIDALSHLSVTRWLAARLGLHSVDPTFACLRGATEA
ncbi:hypothetical protein JCM3774_005294 [Rhodotorula dairenensis]